MQTIPQRPTLTDGPVRLRAPRAEDAAARFKLGNDPDIHHMFGADPATVQPITKAHATTWLHAQQVEPLAWVIEYRKRLAGALRLHTVNHHDGRANLAIGILNPRLLGRGIGTSAVRLIVKHAFDVMGLHRLSLRVVAYNERAVAAYRKVGFVIEGREREAAKVGDTWHDDIIMGLLKSDLASGASS